MSKLVKARYKSAETLAPRFKCCKDALAANTGDTIFTLDLSRRDYMGKACCDFCNTEMGHVCGVFNVTLGVYDAIEVYDLDEGEYANETR